MADLTYLAALLARLEVLGTEGDELAEATRTVLQARDQLDAMAAAAAAGENVVTRYAELELELQSAANVFERRARDPRPADDVEGLIAAAREIRDLVDQLQTLGRP